MSTMYANYRKWIQYEIDRAQEWGKPIVGIRPWGAERIPAEVTDAADEMVYWSTDSVVAAIRRHSLLPAG
ncbi:MAG: TIR domain-containing protein [Chloroflexota bacterium]|nr:TIR domain-containing protein [Chloroflexota bacterium]